MEKQSILSIYNNEQGISAIWVALLLFIFIGLGAFALDFGHIFVAKNELQNAADAGALAGARFLYNEDGTAIKDGSDGSDSANQIAFYAAVANLSENVPVEMLANNIVYAKDTDIYPTQLAGDTEADLDILRGHWSFGRGKLLAKGFYPNASTVPVPLWGVSDEDLDDNLNFINAVQVTTRRTRLPNGTPIVAFFARIFRYDSNGDGIVDDSDNFIEDFVSSATAVAYIGFAGTLAPGDADVPIAICQQSVTDAPSADECGEGTYDCNIGYMLSDGQEKNTAAWTNFSQPCDTADTPELRDLLTCQDSNPDPISLGSSMGATNGVVDAVIGHPNGNNLVDCWKSGKYWVNDDDGDGEIDDNEMASIDTDGDGMPDMPWNLTLPVVNCPALQVSNCMETCGAVNVDVVWILEKENDIDADAPFKMADWSSTDPNGQVRWDSFVTHFKLQKVNSTGIMEPATVENDGFKKKSIYFLPDCTPHELKGSSGGHNYGILARIPVLVQ